MRATPQAPSVAATGAAHYPQKLWINLWNNFERVP